jgi:hypothetical protein
MVRQAWKVIRDLNLRDMFTNKIYTPPELMDLHDQNHPGTLTLSTLWFNHSSESSKVDANF